MVTSAQSRQSLCREAANSDMAIVGRSCQTVDANTFCLAQSDAVVMFQEELSRLEAGDRILNREFDMISLSDTSRDFPVAYLRMMANLPATFVNDNLVMVTTGLVTVADTSDIVGEPFLDELAAVSGTLSAVTDVLSFPPNYGNRTSEVVGQLAAGTEVKMDVRSASGSHVRIAFTYPFGFGRRVSAWIPASSLSDDSAVADLPVLNPGQFTPMQSFLIAPADNCANVDTRTFIQSPGAVAAEIQAYGIDMVINSALVLNLTNPQGNGCYTLQVIPVMGTTLLVDPANPDDLDAAIAVTPTTFFEMNVCLVRDPRGRFSAVVDPQFRANFARFKQDYLDKVADGRALINQTIIDWLNVFAGIPSFLLPYELQPPVIIAPSGIGQPFPIFETFDPPIN
ncbi:MAG: hypothetical protein SNJ54_13520 [Anaerolineae bacterium]